MTVSPVLISQFVTSTFATPSVQQLARSGTLGSHAQALMLACDVNDDGRSSVAEVNTCPVTSWAPLPPLPIAPAAKSTRASSLPPGPPQVDASDMLKYNTEFLSSRSKAVTRLRWR